MPTTARRLQKADRHPKSDTQRMLENVSAPAQRAAGEAAQGMGLGMRNSWQRMMFGAGCKVGEIGGCTMEIGAHGIEDPPGTAIGIGASGEATEFVEWRELWNWFAQGELKGGLWLGACNSGDVAEALSPFLENDHPAIPHIYGFSDDIYSFEIMCILLKLIKFTEINNPPYLDEELGLLRDAVPDTKVKLFYPAKTGSGTWEYMNVDDMPEKIDMTFRQLLERRGSGYGR